MLGKVFTSKRIKRLLIVLAVIVIGFGALRLYINSILKTVIYEEVKSFSKNNYSLKLDKISIGIFAINATIQGFNLKHIPNKLDSIVPFSNITAKSIRLRNLNLVKLVFNRSLQLGKFELIDPVIDLTYHSDVKDTTSSEAAVQLFTIQIKKLQLKNVRIRLIDSDRSATELRAKNIFYEVRTLKLEVNDIVVNQIKADLARTRFTLNKGTINAFNLNDLFNNRIFNYGEIRFDKMAIQMDKNANSIAEDSLKTEQVKSLSEDKFFKSIKPLSINQLIVDIKNGEKKVVFKGKDLSYRDRNFNIKAFELDLDQKFSTHIVSKQLSIKGMDADSINEGYNIAVNSLELEEPLIKLVLKNPENTQDSASSILDLFSIKKINFLSLKKGQIDLSHLQKKHLKAKAKNIVLSAYNVMPSKGALYFDNAAFTASDIFFNTPANLYNLKLSRFAYSQKNGVASMASFQLTPNLSKKLFAKTVAKQVARIELDVKRIDLQGFNLLNMINRETFTCDNVVVNTMKLEFYKDKGIPLLPTDYKKFPQEIIMGAGFGININNVHVISSYISSEVLSPNSKESGKIEIDQVEMLFKTVDNTMATNGVMELIFKGRLAKSGQITARVIMSLRDRNCGHTALIDIGKMPFNKLNTFINDVAHVTIAKGELDKAKIKITGNKKEAKCHLELHYHDLTMKILSDKSTIDNPYKLNIANKLANAIIYNSNPAPGREVRLSESKIAMESNKFIINNWVAVTLQSMIATTAPDAVNFIKRAKKVIKDRKAKKDKS